MQGGRAEKDAILGGVMASDWYRAAKAQRRHDDRSARHKRCNLDLASEKRNRFYRLVFNRNQASHKRRAAQKQYQSAVAPDVAD